MDFKERPFLSEGEFNELMNAGGKRPYEVFNEVLDRVYTRALESALLSFPEVAVSLVRNATEIDKLRKEFFEAHSEVTSNLPAFKEALAALEEREPALQYKELLEKAAKLTAEGTVSATYKPLTRLPEPSLGKLGNEDVGIDEAFTGVLKYGK